MANTKDFPLAFKPCRCGARMIAVTDGWCCESCDRRLVPFSSQDRAKFKEAMRIAEIKERGECPDCINAGKTVCPECRGSGDTECCECGSFVDCDECDGTGAITCETCNGVAKKAAKAEGVA